MTAIDKAAKDPTMPKSVRNSRNGISRTIVAPKKRTVTARISNSNRSFEMEIGFLTLDVCIAGLFANCYGFAVVTGLRISDSGTELSLLNDLTTRAGFPAPAPMTALLPTFTPASRMARVPIQTLS
jgi:hypothetical protein